MKKEMLINVLQPEECRIAIVEDGLLEELYVERTSLENYTGNIYKGRVVNLEAAIQAAFIDFSVGRNGFLHVSDVEPQYYQRLLGEDVELGARDRGRDPRRDRDESAPHGRSRGGDRERVPSRPRPPAPPDTTSERDRPGGEARPRFGADLAPDEEEEPLAAWDDDGGATEEPPSPPSRENRRPRSRRERPDRSEKGRLDRSTSRRFGEGLVEDDSEETPTHTRESSRTPTSRADADRPEGARRAPSPVESELPRGRLPRPIEPIEPEAPRARLPRPIEPEAPRARLPRPIEPIEAELPPSRTQRGRVEAREVQPVQRTQRREDLFDELIVPKESVGRLDEETPESPSSSRGEPEGRRRARGRGRGRPRDTEPAWDRDLEAPLPANGGAEAPDEFTPDLSPEDVDESAEIDADEPRTPRRRGGRDAIRSRGGRGETARPRDESPRHPRGLAAEPTFEPPAAGADIEPPEPSMPRSPARPLSVPRAGEPGYVPRRERIGRDVGEAPAKLETPSRPSPHPVREPLEDEVETDVPFPSRLLDEEATDERPRRRRRRRKRTRDREDELTPRDPAARREDIDDDRRLYGPEDDLELDEDLDEPMPMDELDLEEAESVEDEDEAAGLIREGHTRPVAADEQIDPELEEEIRREIEEIAELEREMGLRGPVEPRPRDRELAPTAPAAPGARPRGRGIKPPIQEVFKRGDEVLVQVIKESIGTKGPTLSTYISIPGRYLVLMPGLNRVGVSRKIADEGQRRKLREIMNELNPPKGLGFIVRTAGLDRTKRELAKDLAYLLRLWKVILKRIRNAKAPAPIYQESDMITRTIRDVFSSDIDTIWIDERGAFERAQEFLRVVMPKFVDRLKYYDEKVPIFHKYGIEDEIAKIQRRHVPLPDGGSIVIDQTEALVAIDVNSGNFRVESDAERTAYEMNLRAAKEIARQLRLRDLGGVIVNDFIDMRDEKHRRGVERALREAVQRDRARTKILRMSQFGLIEMTRQRIRPSLKRSVYEDCTHCKGAGVVKTVESMSIDVMRLLALAAHREDIRRVNVCVAPAVATYLNNRKRPELARLETESNLVVYIHHEEGVPAEHLQIDCFDAHGAEVRLLPSAPPSHPRRR